MGFMYSRMMWKSPVCQSLNSAPTANTSQSVADTKASLVCETDGEIQRSVVDGMGDEVHHLAMDLGIFPAQSRFTLLAASFQFSAFLRSHRYHGLPPLLPR